MRTLKEKFTEKPVELTCALAMALAGIGLTLLEDYFFWQAVGGVLAALGGVLSSWAVTAIDTTAKARAILRAELQMTTSSPLQNSQDAPK